MTSFLIIIDKSGRIHEIKWSSPIYIVTKHGKSIFELFLDEDKEMILEMIEKSVILGELFHCPNSLYLKDKSLKLELCSLPINQQILVFAVEENLLDNGKFNLETKSIFYKFMYTLQQDLKDIIFYNDDSTRFQFEEIQKINNELINTKRELVKANAKLNLLNKDLNNRLVKDALTGLVSRYQYRTEIEHLISQNPEALGIFTFIDIDNFKTINDTYGHLYGDQYLIEFSERLKRLPIENTIKLRISGDEFGLFTHGYNHVEISTTEEIWKHINDYVLATPINIEGNELPVSISAGMAVYGVDTLEIYNLIEYADFAMYRAKGSGKKGYQVFNKKEYEEIKGFANTE